MSLVQTAPAALTPPTSRRVHYGWAIVPLAALVMVATLPGRTHGLGLITEPLLADLKVDRVDFATVNLWATLIGSAFCFPAGWAIDRFGVRLMTFVMLIATGVSAWALSYTSGAYLPLLVIVTLTRGFGQSALSVSSITAVGKWFPHRSGPAMGTYSFLMGILFGAAFGAIGPVVREQGWRTAWSGIAMALIFVLAPLMLLFLRNAKPGAAVQNEEPKTGTTLGAALRTSTFWIFAGATALYGLVSSGLGLFQQAVLAERGFDQKTFHAVLSGTFMISLIGQLAGGWLMSRFGVGKLTGLALALYAAALGCLPSVAGLSQLWTFVGMVGLSGGIIMVVFFAVWSQVFGQAHLGRIQAAAQFVTVIMSAIGPLLFAKCHAITGSYSPILYGLVPTVAIFALAAWRVTSPNAAKA